MSKQVQPTFAVIDGIGDAKCFTQLNDNCNGPSYQTIPYDIKPTATFIELTLLVDHSNCGYKCNRDSLANICVWYAYHHEENFLIRNGLRVYDLYCRNKVTTTELERCRKHASQRLDELRSEGARGDVVSLLASFLAMTREDFGNEGVY